MILTRSCATRTCRTVPSKYAAAPRRARKAKSRRCSRSRASSRRHRRIPKSSRRTHRPNRRSGRLYAALEQLVHLRDPGERCEPLRQMREAQRAAQRLGGRQPVEEYREAGAVGCRDTPTVDRESPFPGRLEGLEPELARAPRARKGQGTLGQEPAALARGEAEGPRCEVKRRCRFACRAHWPELPACLAIWPGFSPDSRRLITVSR